METRKASEINGGDRLALCSFATLQRKKHTLSCQLGHFCLSWFRSSQISPCNVPALHLGKHWLESQLSGKKKKRNKKHFSPRHQRRHSHTSTAQTRNSQNSQADSQFPLCSQSHCMLNGLNKCLQWIPRREPSCC